MVHPGLHQLLSHTETKPNGASLTLKNSEMSMRTVDTVKEGEADATLSNSHVMVSF